MFTPDSPVEIDGKIFDKAIEIENRAADGKPFAGLSLHLNERAVVTVYAACPQDVFGAMLTFAASATGEIVGEPTMITDGGIALTLQLEAGDYFCEFTDYKSYLRRGSNFLPIKVYGGTQTAFRRIYHIY